MSVRYKTAPEFQEWCDGKLHLIILPPAFIGEMPGYVWSTNKEEENLFWKKCDSKCPFFLENGIDVCGCY